MAQKLLTATLMMERKLTDNQNSKQLYGQERNFFLSTKSEKRPRKPAMARSSISEMMAIERLEAAGKLAGWFAHKINNPLGAISGNAQLLARRLQRDIHDPEALQAYLAYIDGIQTQAERCASITAEALNFTRPGEPQLRKTDVHKVIEEALELIRYVHSEKRIEFEYPSNEKIEAARADNEWLTRVIFEVVSNALEASCKTPIKIKVESGENKRGEIKIMVTDSGYGMSEEVCKRVFDPFFSTREDARGLGLTLSLDMMRKMKGSLRVESSTSEGTVLTITIPTWKRRAA